MKSFFTIALLAACLSCGATTNLVGVLTFTNTAGTVNGNSFTVGSDGRVFTNSVYIPAAQIPTNSTIAGSLNNFLEQVGAHPFSQFARFSSDGLTKVTFTTPVETSKPTVTLSSGWGTFAWVLTNHFGTGTAVRTPSESEPDPVKRTNVWSDVADGLSLSTKPIVLSPGGTNHFPSTIMEDPAAGSLLYKRSDGLTEGTFLPSSFSIPMLNWFTNNLADGASITGASFEYLTNSGPAWMFADAMTNSIRARWPMPWDWDGLTVKAEIQALCTGTNSGPAGATNVVFAIRAASNGLNDSAQQPTFGTAVWSTNHFGIGAYTNYTCITTPLTVGNSPSPGKSVLWEIQRLGAQAGDTETNSDMCVTELKIYYQRAVQTALPVSTP